jgi:hypothetical protein
MRVQSQSRFLIGAMILTFQILSSPRSNPPSGLKKDSDSMAFFDKERFKFNLNHANCYSGDLSEKVITSCFFKAAATGDSPEAWLATFAADTTFFSNVFTCNTPSTVMCASQPERWKTRPTNRLSEPHSFSET